MIKKKKISIVIPIYNEAETIPELLKRLTNFIEIINQYKFEIILVEHGSIDQSFTLLKKQAIKNQSFKVLQLSRNFQCDGGIAAGLQFTTGDAAVIMMADLQEPIEMIKKFIEKWEQGYEIVYGVVKKRTSGWLRNFYSKLFYKIINLLTNNMFPENASDFRLIDKKVYQVLNLMKEQNKFLRGLVIWTGFRAIGVPFDRKDRYAGKSKADFITVFNVALNGIFSFSYIPLRLITILGILMSLFSFMILIFFIILFIIYGRTVPGHMSLITFVLLLFGTLFLIIGIIGEYIARIYEEVKNRPNFIVKNKINL